MYKENEIAKARYAVLTKTNMLEYACEVFKGIYKEEECPKGFFLYGYVRYRFVRSYSWN